MPLAPLPRPVHLLNEALAFLTELCALALLCWWGLHTGHGLPLRLLLGLGAPAVAAVVWGLFAAPRAAVRLPLSAVLAVKAAVFGSATAALLALGHHPAALAFAVVALLNTGLAAADRDALTTRSRAEAHAARANAEETHAVGTNAVGTNAVGARTGR
jgi:hypothetical protein